MLRVFIDFRLLLGSCTMASLANVYLEAFPVEEDTVVLRHEDSEARSSFRVCRVCGSLVLDSMTPTHARMHASGE